MFVAGTGTHGPVSCGVRPGPARQESLRDRLAAPVLESRELRQTRCGSVRKQIAEKSIRRSTCRRPRGQAGKLDWWVKDRQQPGHCWVGGDSAEHPRLGTQQVHICQAVTAEHQRDREIEHDLAGIMSRERSTPRCQRRRQTTVNPAGADRLDQYHSAGLADCSRPTGVDVQARIQPEHLVSQCLRGRHSEDAGRAVSGSAEPND